MRRLAATLAFLAVSQAAVLSTGVLCEGAESSPGGVLPMPGMMHHDGPEPQSTSPASQDRHHRGAHCPLMASCVAMAVTVPLLETGTVQRRISAVRVAGVIAPHSEKLAPEPPPPKS